MQQHALRSNKSIARHRSLGGEALMFRFGWCSPFARPFALLPPSSDLGSGSDVANL